jgi:hypothetical protein
MVLIIVVLKAPSVSRFSRPIHYIIALLTIFAFIQIDTAVTASTSEGYKVLPGRDVPFDSAVRQVGLVPDHARQHHVVVVLVEALGLPVAPEEKRLFAAAWDRPEWRRRYEVRLGSSPYFGSTTGGELRELCGHWANHLNFDFEHAHCLPEAFRAAGYATSAIHGFSGDMFNRAEWYPKLAFQKIDFADDLFRAGAGHCDGVFPGACDRDVPRIIEERLASARSPQFIYWLTLNSHLPIMVASGTADVGCDLGRDAWRTDFPRVCRLFQKHQELANSISGMLMARDLPPTDILIVGDHKPPFFDRGNRSHFDPSRVAWIYLKARD